MKWYIMAFKKFLDFSGRSRRKEFWMFVLFNMIAAFVLGLIDNFVIGVPEGSNMGYLTGAYSLITIIPSIALCIRRLHDTDHRGWWLLINIIPVVGFFWLLWLFIKDSDHAPNRFGAEPTAE